MLMSSLKKKKKKKKKPTTKTNKQKTKTPSFSLQFDCLVVLVVKASAWRAEVRGSNLTCDGIFPGRVIPVT